MGSNGYQKCKNKKNDIFNVGSICFIASFVGTSLNLRYLTAYDSNRSAVTCKRLEILFREITLLKLQHLLVTAFLHITML